MNHIRVAKNKTINPAQIVWTKATVNGVELKLSLNYTFHVTEPYASPLRQALGIPAYEPENKSPETAPQPA